MIKHLLPENGQFYKANLHVHTNISDGKLSPEEIKSAYVEKGYSIVAFTDHDVFVPQNDLASEGFLPLNAVEIYYNDGWPGPFQYSRSAHFNLYAKDPNATVCPVATERYVGIGNSKQYITDEVRALPEYKRHYSIDGMKDMIRKANEAGFLVCYNHPGWSLHDYTDYAGLKGLWGIEVFNTGGANGYPDTDQPMVDLLRLSEYPFPVAADDAHSLDSAFGGWVMIKADRLAYESVMKALENGEFYASNGPEIQEITYDTEARTIHVHTSEAALIRLSSESRWYRLAKGSADKPLKEATFSVGEYLDTTASIAYPRYAPHLRVVIENFGGKKAWSKAFFPDELK